nr:Cyclin-like F-box; F-box protein interaction domain; Four-helical cytokine [Medicago truncatula]
MKEKVCKQIHGDLALSITSKLPIKSLKRFGCVCKSWAILFQDPHFMNIYRNNFISKNHPDYDDTSYILRHTVIVPVVDGDDEFHSSLYFLTGERLENKVKLDCSLPFQYLGQDIVIVSSRGINGILCVSDRNETKFAFWNPSTKELKIIPPSPIEAATTYRNCYPLILGFGYDHVRDDYKVIRHVRFGELNFYECAERGLECKDVPWKYISYQPIWEIYSLRSNSWREIVVKLPMRMDRYNSCYIDRFYIDGMCHWSYICVLKETCLVSFDVSNEVYFTTPMPSYMDDGLDHGLVPQRLVMLFNGFVSLISYYEEKTTFHISVLGEIGVRGSWTKLIIIDLLPCVKHPIGGGKNGNIFFIKDKEELVCFDLGTLMIEELVVEGNFYMSQMVIYRENVLPIIGMNN